MVKIAPQKAVVKETGIKAFTNNIKVNLKTGRITSANILIAKVDFDKNDTEESVKQWILDEHPELVEKAFQKYESACSARRSTLKQTSARRKEIKVELKDELLRERVKKSLTKPRKKKAQ